MNTKLSMSFNKSMRLISADGTVLEINSQNSSVSSRDSPDKFSLAADSRETRAKFGYLKFDD